MKRISLDVYSKVLIAKSAPTMSQAMRVALQLRGRGIRVPLFIGLKYLFVDKNFSGLILLRKSISSHLFKRIKFKESML